ASRRSHGSTLLDGAIDDDDHNVRFLEKIENNVLRLNHLVTDLLSLARIESQQGRLPLQPVDLHALLEEALRRHEPSALAREQRLVVEAPAGALRVLGDREALTQVIDNLIDNALKYTPDTGAVHVRVQQSEGSTLLEVADDGVGIPQEDQARIFERFYRVDKARSRAVGGTGLGLSIVKHLVGAMQGTIELQSEPGEGSAFRIVLAAA
ncbi:MAG: ATP-binding protein, partial [Planctomycetota bacterium]